MNKAEIRLKLQEKAFNEGVWEPFTEKDVDTADLIYRLKRQSSSKSDSDLSKTIVIDAKACDRKSVQILRKWGKVTLLDRLKNRFLNREG